MLLEIPGQQLLRTGIRRISDRHLILRGIAETDPHPERPSRAPASSLSRTTTPGPSPRPGHRRGPATRTTTTRSPSPPAAATTSRSPASGRARAQPWPSPGSPGHTPPSWPGSPPGGSPPAPAHPPGTPPAAAPQQPLTQPPGLVIPIPRRCQIGRAHPHSPVHRHHQTPHHNPPEARGFPRLSAESRAPTPGQHTKATAPHPAPRGQCGAFSAAHAGGFNPGR